ncbi:sigma-70 family RNA polymerase sigma factor [Rubinisphaera sp.]|mgnify:FL=1|uniref:RNA polymerase sigma factor n=1 Tax=Rubinisphaera sp. TaxID=2024857 RepID=UPI000C11071D|nr:sigma-70 family RNA polymerase sigma factor [Rubinisphaera sp.]MBV10893.1 hypothetical protein [Rubinisphaera sp.]HCS54191.1 hypothetical protein [Planctomycetaceae bacterium]|tara:strand:+ start:1600 stop:2166 length:567 start_codon:yes stop_codon:yes gene_type:complete
MSLQNLQQIQEQLLVLQAQSRNSVAFQQLVQTYERRLFYYLQRFTGASADSADLMQEIWLNVYQKLPGLNAPEAFRVWLYKIAHNRAVSYLRKRDRQTAAAFYQVQNGSITESEMEQGFEQLENAELVHRVLEQLSLPHREVLTLRFLEDLSLQEISEIISTSIGTVKSRLHYARLEMRKVIEEEYNG